MALADNNSAADTALELIRAEGPLRPADIVDRVLKISNADTATASRLAAALLDDDPRCRRLPDGSWTLKETAATTGTPLERAEFVVVDVETTGFAPPADRVIEVGMVRVAGGQVVDSWDSLINPRRPLPGPITSLTGISHAMVAGQPTFEQVCGRFVDFLGDSVFVAHNAPFDWRFVQNEMILSRGRKLLNRKLCTRALAHRLVPELSRRGLDEVARFFNLSFDDNRHRALGDAEVTAVVLLRLCERAADRGILTLEGLFELAATPPSRLR